MARYLEYNLCDWGEILPSDSGRMEGDERDHLLYFSRARLLSLNGNTILNHPDLQQVQVLGLIAFYLLATSQINR